MQSFKFLRRGIALLEVGPARISLNPAHVTDFLRTDIANVIAPIYIAELLLQRRTQTLSRFQI